MVTLDGMQFASGWILFAASYDETAVEEAKLYCKKYNLTPAQVSIKIKKDAETKEPKIVVVEVI